MARPKKKGYDPKKIPVYIQRNRGGGFYGRIPVRVISRFGGDSLDVQSNFDYIEDLKKKGKM